MSDFNWMSQGGLTVSGGDVAVAPDLVETAQLALSRVKAAAQSWQLYSGIGANLNSVLGSTGYATAEARVIAAILRALTNQFLSSGEFSVEALASGSSVTAFVFLKGTLLITAIASTDGSLSVSSPLV